MFHLLKTMHAKLDNCFLFHFKRSNGKSFIILKSGKCFIFLSFSKSNSFLAQKSWLYISLPNPTQTCKFAFLKVVVVLDVAVLLVVFLSAKSVLGYFR